MFDSVYDLVISNSYKIKGKIESIELYQDENIINNQYINDIDYNYLSQIEIYTNMPHFPNNINIWKIYYSFIRLYYFQLSL